MMWWILYIVDGMWNKTPSIQADFDTKTEIKINVNANKVAFGKMEGEKILMAAGVTAAVVTAAFVFWGPTGLDFLFS